MYAINLKRKDRSIHERARREVTYGVQEPVGVWKIVRGRKPRAASMWGAELVEALNGLM